MASIRRVRRARRPFSLLAGGKRTPATFGNVRNSLGQAICQLECPIEEIFSRYLLFGARSWIAFLVTVGVPLNFTLGGVRTAQERASLCVGLSIFRHVCCLSEDGNTR